MMAIFLMVIRSIYSTCFFCFSSYNAPFPFEFQVDTWNPCYSSVFPDFRYLEEFNRDFQFSCLSFLAGCCTNKENNLPETQLLTRCQISLHSLGSSSSSPSVSPSKDTEKVKSQSLIANIIQSYQTQLGCFWHFTYSLAESSDLFQ